MLLGRNVLIGTAGMEDAVVNGSEHKIKTEYPYCHIVNNDLEIQGV
ncbi:hypothetical protein [Komagataeibacter rhaeticus]|uniref:Uncharacterized protein n=1 Tax=Komagataeibacter rhaeticus TaxID=215221 RepID=A0A858JQJ6_9PROT|nr:hypothetical protein [Komagataeibacter rhaeticus]QIP36358.1 hypothetical protein GWK63_13480 [Komagataeibacter rhaeticus]QOC46122.1 hypothetical protein ICJ78_13550 [Komagataeibacter rhaeticus]WPP21271.1 hypothetical protein SCD25_12735 [Komagataeibacter rhaeticus]